MNANRLLFSSEPGFESRNRPVRRRPARTPNANPNQGSKSENFLFPIFDRKNCDILPSDPEIPLRSVFDRNSRFFPFRFRTLTLTLPYSGKRLPILDLQFDMIVCIFGVNRCRAQHWLV